MFPNRVHEAERELRRAVASALRTAAKDPELAAYIRTELRGDASRIAVLGSRAAPRARVRYWLNGFRGFAVLDLRAERTT
ncbi:MAG TPA: hypothetical protein VF992_05955 [Thermoplasmata archaeon]